MRAILAAGVVLCAGSCGAAAATLQPDAVLPGGIALRIAPVVQAFPLPAPARAASPVNANGALHVVDQSGRILRQTEAGGFAEVFSLTTDAPAGVTDGGGRAILNISQGPGATLDVSLLSTTLPAGAAAALPLPAPLVTGDPYTNRGYQLIYRYAQGADGTLSAPTLLGAIEAQTTGHRGGGMLTFDDGRVLFSTGDYLPFGLDGFAAPQDPALSPSKLLLLDGQSGDVSVVAQGLRNVQQLSLTGGPDPYLVFADIGSAAAEEVNAIPLAEVLDTSVIENFGWGRNPGDGLAREGGFYIDEGRAGGAADTNAVGLAPVPEVGFVQPHAQFGREEAPFVAVSGPIVAETAFDTIMALFGDLVSGKLYATRAGFDQTFAGVVSVDLVDAAGVATSLMDLTGGVRPDPRFFVWADGSAGVLLETNGTLYRLTEVGAVPLPAGAWFLLVSVVALGWHARRRA